MAKEKRYNWMKLPVTYFRQLRQKKMRIQENGSELQIVYLEMMLLSVETEGIIFYQGVFDTLEEEISIAIDEPAELIKKTIDFIVDNQMAVIDDREGNIFLPDVKAMIGSECGSAERVRRYRERQKALQCNSNVTKGNTETEIETETETEEAGRPGPPDSAKQSVEDWRKIARDGKVDIDDKGIVDLCERIREEGGLLFGKPIDNPLKALRGYVKIIKREPNKKNSFHNFDQRAYDYEDLEKKLLARERK